MAQLCATCGARKAHPTHLKAVAGSSYHEFLDPRGAAKLAPQSAGRTAYINSKQHRDAMELSAGATDCWPAAYGAPGECYGKIGPSHTLSSGAHGGLKEADKFPAPPACQAHNDGMEQDAEMRAWATTHYFTHNGRQWPFKITDAWLTAEAQVPR